MFRITIIHNGEIEKEYDVDTFSIDNTDIMDISVNEHEDMQIEIEYIGE